MGNCELNEELAKMIAEFLLEIPDDVWRGLFDELPEFQKMPEGFKNWPFGKQAVVLMMGALNDYWVRSEVHWGRFYRKIQELLPMQPDNVDDFLSLYPATDPRRFRRAQNFLKLAKELWEKSPEYFKENLEDIWDKLADTMGQCREDKTITLAMKDLVILLMKMENDDSVMFQIKLPVLVDKRIMNLTINLAKIFGKCDEKEVGKYRVQKFWDTVLKKLNDLREERGKSPLTMIHLDTLLWSMEKQLFEGFKDKISHENQRQQTPNNRHR